MTEPLPPGKAEDGPRSESGRCAKPEEQNDADQEATIVGRKGAPIRPHERVVSPVLGVVVVYSSSADPSASASHGTSGNAYPLRAGEVLFVGKPPARRRIPLRDGVFLEVAQCHLFPRTHEYVSRSHLTLEMQPGGLVTLTDFSTNGTFLVNAQKHVIREEKEYETVEFRGREILVLGVETAERRSSAERAQLEVVPFDRETRGARPGDLR